MRDEKLHAAVARSRFGSRNAKNTSLSENFWMLRCSKSACCCSAKYIAKSKSAKHTTFGALLEVEMSKIVARSTCRSQNAKSTTCSEHFWTFNRYFVWRAQWILHLCQEWAKREGILAVSKTMAGVGRRGSFEEDLQRCISRGRRNTRDISIKDVGRSGPGRWFPERGCILIWGIRSSGLLRWFCMTGAALRTLFRGMRNTLDRWSGKITKRNQLQ